jgi:hypothetical protein
MAATKKESDPDSEDSTVINVAELRQFADSLAALATSYDCLAAWFESHGIKEIPGGGTPTAKLGLRHMGNFTSTVLTAYQEAVFKGTIKTAPPEMIGKAYAAEAIAKNLANSRRKKK